MGASLFPKKLNPSWLNAAFVWLHQHHTTPNKMAKPNGSIAKSMTWPG
jgi:hypothetical protein